MPAQQDASNNNRIIKAGDLTVDATGPQTSYRIEHGGEKFAERASALPNLKRVFDRVASGSKIEKGDVIVVRYGSGKGYAEVVTAAEYDPSGKLKSLTAAGSRNNGVSEKQRENLFKGAKFNAATSGYTRENWDPKNGDIEFFVLRSKGGRTEPAAPSPAAAVPASAPRTTGQTATASPPKPEDKHPIAEDKQAKPEVRETKTAEARAAQNNKRTEQEHNQQHHVALTDTAKAARVAAAQGVPIGTTSGVEVLQPQAAQPPAAPAASPPAAAPPPVNPAAQPDPARIARADFDQLVRSWKQLGSDLTKWTDELEVENKKVRWISNPLFSGEASRIREGRRLSEARFEFVQAQQIIEPLLESVKKTPEHSEVIQRTAQALKEKVDVLRPKIKAFAPATMD